MWWETWREQAIKFQDNNLVSLVVVDNSRWLCWLLDFQSTKPNEPNTMSMKVDWPEVGATKSVWTELTRDGKKKKILLLLALLDRIEFLYGK